MTDDKIVTRADLATLQMMRKYAAVSPEDGELDILDRLIAAAEADAPPLPEGWVLAGASDGSSKVVWHKDGRFSLWDDGTAAVDVDPKYLTPLTFITAEQVDEAAKAVREGLFHP